MSIFDKTKGEPGGVEFRKAAEEKYGTVVRTAMDGFWLIDASGRIIDTNDAYCRMTGHSREELNGMHISGIEAKESNEEVAAHMLKVMKLGSDRFETCHRCKHGRIIDLEVNANYLDIDGGQFFAFFKDITELKINDAKLRVLSSVVEQSPTAALITNADGVIEYANPQFETACGYSLSELTGKKPNILKSGVHPPEFYKDLWSTVASGRPWRGDICNRKKNGELYWELRSISPIKNSSGEITHYVAVQIEDIERKKAEEALKASELRYRMLHLTSFDGIIMSDSSGKITECSISAEQIFGYGPGGMQGLELAALMPDNLRLDYLTGFRNFVLTGERKVHNALIETEGIRKNGEVFPVELSINSLYINGKLFITGSVRDITERKKIEEKLRGSEERLAEAQRLAHLGNWEWDIAANELWWSDEIYRIFGLNRQEFGATYEAFLNSVHPEDREAVRKSVNEALHNKAPYKILHRIVLPGGDVRIVHERAEVLLDANGKPLRMRGTVQDITECKLMEEEIHKAQKLESLGVLAGGIAHDFNNILTGIVGNVFLMKKACAPDNAIAERLGMIDSAINRAKGLTHKLLTFSSGGAPVKQTIDLARLATDTARLVFSGSRVKFDINADEGLWAVEADEGQIDQVLQNIYMNALQAIPEAGNVSISIENSACPKQLPDSTGSYVKIIISDNGPGIPNKHISKIFDPFFTTKPGGNGLGLSICFSIVKRHSGFIKVESSVNNGTDFFLYLPALETAPSTTGETLVIPKSLAERRSRILVMDDEEMVRNIAGEILTDLGYKVILASEGEEALNLYRQAMDAEKPIDLVILDLTVQGGMGGKEAVSLLLSMDPEAKAIVSSGYCNSPVMANYKKYGFKGVLQKPYNLTEFSTAVRKALGES
ncbi:MAG: hypothetical protein A2052_07440 [Deltaproteobacteria bacterium GWA2_54_12]|nr:MAG: hypothetical protein A2052_07440 [Deltaproteobacteria bacterium GWA2_54_12]